MRILFINQIDVTGGAAVAAWRIAEALKKHYNTENYFITASKNSSSPFVYDCTPSSRTKRVIDEYLIKITSAAGLQYVYIPFHRIEILNAVRRIKPDIINLHNIHGSYFQTGLLKELSKFAPVAWTLHDMWAITRNASYTYGNDKWMKLKSFAGEKNIYPFMGYDTGNYLIKRKMRIYTKSRISVIAPSEWLYNCSKNSPLFENKEVVNIPYAINTEYYSPGNKPDEKRKMGICNDMKSLFFNCDWIKREPRKGGELIPRILLKLNEMLKNKISIIASGRDRLENIESLNKMDFRFIGNVSGDEKVRDVLRGADLVLHPSLADNLPNLLLEAGACGTPAAAFNVGGTSDIVIDEKTGILEAPFDVENFCRRIASLLDNDEKLRTFSENSRNHVTSYFSSEKTAESYHNYFVKIIQKGN